jgi:hypothetical protein
MNGKIIIISKEIFYALSEILGIFFIMEIIKPGIVTAYLNMNYLLIFWLIAGILILLNERTKKDG